jgi:SlyX protein
MDNERLVEIEIKLTRQEDLLDELNRALYAQQRKLDELQSLCAALAEQLRRRDQEPGERPPHERPPHY